MVLVAGEREKVALEGSADTVPPAQPATASNTGGKIIAARPRVSLRAFVQDSPRLRGESAERSAIWIL
jgi:hypothetical protein